LTHTLWWHLIRLIVAAHLHVAPHDITEIDYWGGPPGAADPSHVWTYRTGDCDYRTWGRYDACIATRTPPFRRSG